MKNRKGIYEGIRKPLAPPTRVFKDKRQDLIEKSIKNEIDEDICNCDNIEPVDNRGFTYICKECGEFITVWDDREYE